jgi:hypothetical protein
VHRNAAPSDARKQKQENDDVLSSSSATAAYRTDTHALTSSFEGLQLTADGSTTVHGAGSFFKLSRGHQDDSGLLTEGPSMTGSKVNLTNSAWLERVREGEARIPV